MPDLAVFALGHSLGSITAAALAIRPTPNFPGMVLTRTPFDGADDHVETDAEPVMSTDPAYLALLHVRTPQSRLRGVTLRRFVRALLNNFLDFLHLSFWLTVNWTAVGYQFFSHVHVQLWPIGRLAHVWAFVWREDLRLSGF
jgi:hypothetical protein